MQLLRIARALLHVDESKLTLARRIASSSGIDMFDTPFKYRLVCRHARDLIHERV